MAATHRSVSTCACAAERSGLDLNSERERKPALYPPNTRGEKKSVKGTVVLAQVASSHAIWFLAPANLSLSSVSAPLTKVSFPLVARSHAVCAVPARKQPWQRYYTSEHIYTSCVVIQSERITSFPPAVNPPRGV